MNILILGASSQIGRELALCFSQGNSLTLLGRSDEGLRLIQQQCLAASAALVDVIVHDISEGTNSLIEKFCGKQFDLVINLVSATSRVKDSEFVISQLDGYLKSDLLVPIELIQNLIENSCRPLKVIFISSVLAAVPSPDRMLYGSLKLLHELCLQKLVAEWQGTELLVVKVGMVVSHTQSSEAAKNLASAVYIAHQKKLKVLNYGLLGKMYVLLFNIQPVIFKLLVQLQRMIRSR